MYFRLTSSFTSAFSGHVHVVGAALREMSAVFLSARAKSGVFLSLTVRAKSAVFLSLSEGEVCSLSQSVPVRAKSAAFLRVRAKSGIRNS